MIENIDPKILKKLRYRFLLRFVFGFLLIGLLSVYLINRFYFEAQGYTSTFYEIFFDYALVFIIFYSILFLASVFFNHKIALIQIYIAIVPVLALLFGNVLMAFVHHFDFQSMGFLAFLDLYKQDFSHWNKIYQLLYLGSYLAIPIVSIPVGFQLLKILYFNKKGNK
jgi:hypothetical protein